MSVTIASLPDPRTPGKDATQVYAFLATEGSDFIRGVCSVVYQCHPSAADANAGGQPIASISVTMTADEFAAFVAANQEVYNQLKAAFDTWASQRTELTRSGTVAVTVNP